MIKTLVLSFLICINTYAQFDLSTNAGSRSYPSPTGYLELEGGYSKLLWGARPSGADSSPMYGLIRSSLAVATSVVVHEYDARVTLYPISFIGLGHGHKEMYSDFDEFSDYDCEKVRCTGDIKRDYFFGKAILAYSNLITSFQYLESRNSYSFKDSNEDLPVAEYGLLTLVSPKHEQYTERTYFIGYKLGADVIGAFSTHTYFKESEQNSALNILIYKTQFKNIGTTFGVGTFLTDHIKPGGAITLKLDYAFSPSMALF